MAIAGGVNLSLHPSKYRALQEAGMLSSQPRSQGLGMSDGMIPGEGVGVAILKPLQAALTAGDAIYGVIKASVVNHGGHASGFQLPNPTALAEVARKALRQADLQPAAVDYIETAANGSPYGDAIEIAGLAKVYGEPSSQTVPIGTVKSNIGHLEAASGISQLSKVLLQMRHYQLAPSIHADPPNPDCELERTAFAINRTLVTWPGQGRSNGESGRTESGQRGMIAAINSLGAGGVNTHLLVASAPPANPGEVRRPTESQAQLILVSAFTKDRLRARVSQLQTWLSARDHVDLGALAYTLQQGREPMAERLALIVSNRTACLACLAAFVAGGEHEGLAGTAQVSVHYEPQAWSAEYAAALPSERRTRLQALAQRWLTGDEIPWAEVEPRGDRHRLHVPSYPFAGKRYWLPRQADPQVPHTAVDGNSEKTGAPLVKGTGELLVESPVDQVVVEPVDQLDRKADRLIVRFELQEEIWQDLP